jgi:hypothetical protein
MSLPIFDPKRKCPACGATDSTALVTEPTPTKTAGHPQEDHFDVTCNMCGNLRFERAPVGKPALGADPPKSGPDLLLGNKDSKDGGV